VAAGSPRTAGALGPAGGQGRVERPRLEHPPTAGGVDANASTTHRYEVARKLDVPGRSSMSKQELVEAIDKANRRRTRKARER
jgi:hypothetical protein